MSGFAEAEQGTQADTAKTSRADRGQTSQSKTGSKRAGGSGRRPRGKGDKDAQQLMTEAVTAGMAADAAAPSAAGSCEGVGGSRVEQTIGELLAASDTLSERAEATRQNASSALSSLQGSMLAAVAQVSEWVGAERENMNQAFAEALQRDLGVPGEVSELLAFASVLNLANPEPSSKLVISVVILGSGLLIRTWNASVSASSAALLERHRDLLDAQFDALDQARNASASAMLEDFVNGSEAALDLVFLGGSLRGLSERAQDVIEDLGFECSGEQSASSRRLEHELEQADRLLVAIEDAMTLLDTLSDELERLAHELPAELQRTYKQALHTYTDWLAGGGGDGDRTVRVGGTIVWNENDLGGGTLSADLALNAIGSANADGDFTAQTNRFALGNLREMTERGFHVEFEGALRLERMTSQRQPVTLAQGRVGLELDEVRCETWRDDAHVVERVGTCDPTALRPSAADPAVTGGACHPSYGDPEQLLHELLLSRTRHLNMSERV